MIGGQCSNGDMRIYLYLELCIQLKQRSNVFLPQPEGR